MEGIEKGEMEKGGFTRTIEKAAMLPKKLHNETASGVRWVTSLMGITGYGAQHDSTRMKRTHQTPLASRSPQTIGLDQASSSVDFRLRPRRRHPTVPTSVREPKPSIRWSFARTGWFAISSGSLMLTFAMTRMYEKRRTGICEEVNTGYKWAVFFEIERRCQLTWRRNAERLQVRGRVFREYHRGLLFPTRRRTHHPNVSFIHPPRGPPNPAPRPNRLELELSVWGALVCYLG